MLDSILRVLYAWDVRALYDLNVAWNVPALDSFWSQITYLHKQLWFLIGCALPLLIFVLARYRGYAVRALLATLCAVSLTDALAYRVVKHLVNRPRPFDNPELSWVQKRGIAHGPSFPSNHAANAFAAATMLSFYGRRGRIGFFALAVLIGLSRPILGVHYPSDVVAGACLGVAVAFALSRAFAAVSLRKAIFRTKLKMS